MLWECEQLKRADMQNAASDVILSAHWCLAPDRLGNNTAGDSLTGCVGTCPAWIPPSDFKVLPRALRHVCNVRDTAVWFQQQLEFAGKC
jgi:hypothetical protein